VRLVTLRKQDPLFQAYLTGHFSKTERALPIQSLNVDTETEQITFEIKNKSDIAMPHWIFKWPTVLRFKSMAQVTVPLLLVLAKNLLDETVTDLALGLLAGLGAIVLYVGLNLFNDYIDHLRGLDRIYPEAGNRAIQKGWVAAWTVRAWAIGYLCVGGLLGLPALLGHSEILWLVVVITGLGFLGIVLAKRGRKLNRLSEFLAFLLLGPLLTLGFQLALGGDIDIEVLAIGFLTGWFAVFRLHFKNFQQLMIGVQSKFVNSMTSLGFEKAKLALKLWWLVFVAAFLIYYFIYSNILWLILAIALQSLTTFLIFKRMDQLQSPVGSAVSELAKAVSQSSRLIVLYWVAVGLWQISFIL
jgi:1,4-dihydroxy-2-naphthoate octaprenyltransferase